MENEKNLNENPTFQELPDESLDTMAGGGGGGIRDNIHHFYGVGMTVWANVPREEGPLRCLILEYRHVYVSLRYCAAYKVQYRSLRHNKRFMTAVIREDDILGY